MDLHLNGKRALITGGSRGIGKAIARALALEGVRVVIAARTAAPLQEAVDALLVETGGEVHGLTADTRQDRSVEALITQAVDLLGGLDIVVNAAATPRAVGPGGASEVRSADLLEEFDTKVAGYFRVIQAASPHLVANGWGRIINISGLAARQTGALTGSVRNVAVAALTKSLADELGPKGINVTVVHPGATRTERTAAIVAARVQQDGGDEASAERALYGNSLIGRIVEAHEVADVVAFLASPRSVAINGDAIAAGGGTPKTIHY